MQSKPGIRYLIAGLALSLGAPTASAGPVAVAGSRDRDAIVSQVMQSWQQRILSERLPVEDAANWSRRNLAKFSRLTAEQIDLARSAASLGELELLLMNPPVPEGSRLGLVLASQSHNVSMLGKGYRANASPATAPGSYADMVFTAVTPCRILDSRASQGGTGPWPAGSTNSIKIGPYSAAGGGYATGAGAQGGSATGCGLDTLAGPGKIAVVMVAVSTVAQAGAGYLTFFSAGAPNPGATSVSQWYQAGYVQTSFVLIPSDLVGAVSASGFSSATTEVIIDVAGYFAAPGNINLANSTATTGNIIKGGYRFIHNFGADVANDGNTFIGESAGNFTMNGYGNTGGGNSALSAITSGSNNTALGIYALLGNTAGNSNSAAGGYSLYNNTTGSNNTASGVNALSSNTTGANNTANGRSALISNVTGNYNTASGDFALNTNLGNFNTANGSGALFSNANADSNTAVGGHALFYNTTGANNIAIGAFAGQNLTTGSNNINIGNVGGAGEGGTIRIGTPGIAANAFIAGIRGVTTGAANAVAVLIDSNGQLGTINSSRRFKDDIADMGDASAALMRLRPVTFHYKSDRNPAGPALQYGLIAEEVAQTYPGLVAYSTDGTIETVLYQHLPTMLLNEYQKQQRRIDAQAAQISQQREVIAQLELKSSEIDALKSAVYDMGKMIDQLRRGNSVTASLPGR